MLEEFLLSGLSRLDFLSSFFLSSFFLFSLFSFCLSFLLLLFSFSFLSSLDEEDAEDDSLSFVDALLSLLDSLLLSLLTVCLFVCLLLHTSVAWLGDKHDSHQTVSVLHWFL